MTARSLPLLFFFVLAQLAPAARPTIDHAPLTLAPPGERVRVIATVNPAAGDEVGKVLLKCTVNQTQAPSVVTMADAGAGVYVGYIPAEMAVDGSKIFYFIEAHAKTGEWGETPIHSIDVSSAPIAPTPRTTNPPPDRSTPKPPVIIGEEVPYTREEEKKARKKKYTWTAAAVAAAVAIGAWALGDSGSSSDSGTDSGGGATDGTTTGGTTGGTNTDGGTTTDGSTSDGSTGGGTTTDGGTTGGGTNTVGGTDGGNGTTGDTLIKVANDNVTTSIVQFPVDTVVDISSELAGRQVNQAMINLAYDPVDGFAERFLVFHGNTLVFDSGVAVASGSVQLTSPGASPIVSFRVASSTRNDLNLHNWSWSGSVNYTLIAP